MHPSNYALCATTVQSRFSKNLQRCLFDTEVRRFVGQQKGFGLICLGCPLSFFIACGSWILFLCDFVPAHYTFTVTDFAVHLNAESLWC